MKMTLLKAKCTAFIAGLLLAGSANANLIVNGGFEDNAVANGNWSWFPASSVNGWEGSNVEIWHNLFGIASAEGQQHAELNADGGNSGAWSIFQQFGTVVGQSYDVSFAYRARESSDLFKFVVGSINSTFTNSDTTQWKLFSSSFVATSTLTTLTFTSLNTGTYGNLLDDVKVNAHVSLPESNTFALFAIGLIGLGLVRRRAKI
ncbi:hypothetical protein GCM10011613_21220 [Cellvibrio zantedeschiae]|uniref:PEP-CTERM protein-sorting domain-containing protein n=1 Tax=Cellvibrio zantedeschiae TaxID=1237077 RepID=A0ABQ3B380_9GAMM|nr:PEP-CTERM sorting domain-containing protein [Cellvibrio zantedeschiae]GGY75463.1 hypothetical protein GCM10011613_21220 [Cellvibrio zantedeschiae]